MDPAAYDRMASIEADHWWFAGRRLLIEDTIRRLPGWHDSMRVLEAGCGSGGNLEMLRGTGNLDAFEFDATARERATERSGLPVAFGALPDRVPFEGRSYDLICLLDVLEHVEQDREALAALAARLAPGGGLLITVPAFQSLWSRHDLRNHHFRRYTKGTLSAVAQSAGLRIERSFYFNCLLFPLAVGSRAVKGLLGSDAPDDRMPSPAVNKLLLRIFAAERHFVRQVPVPFGLSLCAVLKTGG